MTRTKKAAAVLCLCLMLGACATAPPAVTSTHVIDASSEAAFDESLKQMYGSLDSTGRMKLALAIYILNLADLRAQGKLAADARPSEPVKPYALADKLNGKRAAEIIEMADE